MPKVTCTIWSLILYLSGISIFHPFLCDSLSEDDVIGLQLTSGIFVSGVYIIITHVSLFPSGFKKPGASILCLYEFFATSFILDFFGSCIWTPIDVMIMTTLPHAICHSLSALNYNDAAEWIVSNQELMRIMSLALSAGFLLEAIHVTKALDFSMYNECGVINFAEYTKDKLWQRILSEIPRTTNRDRCSFNTQNQRPQSSQRSSSRRRHRSKSRRCP